MQEEEKPILTKGNIGCLPFDTCNLGHRTQFNVIILLTASKQATFALPFFSETPCFPDNLQLSYYSCRHLAPFSHTTFCSFSVHCNYNVPIFSCTVYKLIRVGTAVCIYDISRKEDKDGDWWFSITGKYSEVTILPQEGAAVAYNYTFLPWTD